MQAINAKGDLPYRAFTCHRVQFKVLNAKGDLPRGGSNKRKSPAPKVEYISDKCQRRFVPNSK